MSKLSTALGQQKAFLPFLTCGDPDLNTTIKLAKVLAEKGADALILGIPFSDPTAEGAVIQTANIRALTGGATTDRIFEAVKKIRKVVSIPLVFQTYANVVFSYGIERFVKTSADLGIDGLIVPDVPFEEKEEFDVVCKANDTDFISMIAPTSASRISMIASAAEGFVYAVSGLGVSDEQAKMQASIEDTVSAIQSSSNLPCIVGVGISTTEQASYMTVFADGVIVDTAITELVAAHGSESVPYVAELAEKFVKAIRK